MDKTILFLINGFGIEKKDSYPIYNAEVMPTLDRVIKEGMFASIESPATDIENGYRFFNTGTLSLLEKPYFENIITDNLLLSNSEFLKFKETVDNCSGNIHIFLYLEDKTRADVILDFIKNVRSKKEQKIYLHFILVHKEISDYKFINKIISRIKLSLPSNAKCGYIFGNSQIENNDINNQNDFTKILRLLYGKAASEKWENADAKLSRYYDTNILPMDAKPFAVEEAPIINKDDLIFFYNYYKYNATNFIDALKKANLYITNFNVDPNNSTYYSLFPLSDKETTSYLYDSIIASNCLAKSMENIGKTALVLLPKDKLNMASYMNNGLSGQASLNVKYALTDEGVLNNEEQMRILVNDPNYQFIIINHFIDNYYDADSLKQELTKIDKSLEIILRVTDNNIPILISSLYGIKKEINIANNGKALIDFTGLVPSVLINSNYNTPKYRLFFGNTHTLLTTSLKILKPDLKVDTIIRKKSLLTRLLVKGK